MGVSHVESRWMIALILLGTSVVAAEKSAAEKSHWVEGDQNPTGANRQYYNSAAQLAWQNFMGDWHDAQNQPQGSEELRTLKNK